MEGKNNKKGETDKDKEIVISGVSGRFPEAEDLEEFQDNLFSGVDMITDDGRRWTPGLFGLPRAGKLKVLDRFDAGFFQVHAKQADYMDPQLRMLMEVVHEAIYDAGVNPVEIRSSNTGVFVGASCSESEIRWATDNDCRHGYTLTGCTRGMFSNRISFIMDLKGPSFTVDTACSSSCMALHHAVTSIRSGICDAAIVAGTHICLSPQMCQQFHRMNMLAADGKCRSFDAAGSGYVRSEAVVAIFLQKKDVARRNYASILAIRTNTDGYKASGVTFPSGQMQQTLLEEAYRDAGVNPLDVSYIEAHGTGTPAGDPAEVNAIAGALCKERSVNNPLLIGSVKSNMGHAEPASGLCGLVKLLVSMVRGEIPGNLHFKMPNPNIPALLDGQLKVVTENTKWEGGIVGLNSFGFGGSNVHVILKSNPMRQRLKIQDLDLQVSNSKSEKLPILIPFSGRTKQAVDFALEKITIKESHPDPIQEQVCLLHKISEMNIPGHKYRGFSINSQSATNVLIETTEMPGSTNSRLFTPPQVWFIFNGMGSQYPSMCRDLFKFKTFAESLQKSAKILQPLLDINLLDIIQNGSDKTFDNVLYAFVAIASVQIALVDLLRSLKIHPDGIIGHSVGELVAAYADECLSADQVMLAAHARGVAVLESSPADGNTFSMAAVGLSWDECQSKCPPNIYPACHNSKDSVTVSGPAKDIQSFVEQLKNEGIFAKEVNSSGQAFHSPYILPAKAKFKESLDKIITSPANRSKRWVSSSIPQSERNSDLALTSSSSYHVNNLCSPVLFKEALEHVPENAVVIEIGPHSLLQAILKRSLPPSCINIGLLHKNKADNAVCLLQAIGRLYNAGLNPVLSKLYPPAEFPVPIETPPLSSLIRWDHSQSWNVPNFSPEHISNSKGGGIEFNFEICLGKDHDEFYAGHKIDNRIVFPATGLFQLVWKAFASLQGCSFEQLPIVLEHVRVVRVVLLERNKTTPVQFSVSIFRATGEFQITENGNLIASGIIRCHQVQRGGTKLASEFLPLKPLEMQDEKQKDFSSLEKTPEVLEMAESGEEERLTLSTEDAYKELRLRGYDYAGEFKGILQTDPERGCAELEFTGNWVTFLDTILQFTILHESDRVLFLPSYLEKAVFDPTLR